MRVGAPTAARGRRCGRRRHAGRRDRRRGGGPGRRRGVVARVRQDVAGGRVGRRTASRRPGCRRGTVVALAPTIGAAVGRSGAGDAIGSVVSRGRCRRDGGTTGCDPVSDSQETGTGRFDRNQADAISSKIGVVSPRSNALAFGSWPGNCPSGSRDGTRGANSSSAGSGSGCGGPGCSGRGSAGIRRCRRRIGTAPGAGPAGRCGTAAWAGCGPGPVGLGGPGIRRGSASAPVAGVIASPSAKDRAA